MNLAQLIVDRKAGRSYAALARDCGGSPSDKRLQQLANYPIKEFPDPATIRALGRGLRVTETEVVLAVAETLGLDVGRGGLRLADRLPGSVDLIPDAQKDALVALVLSMIPAREESSDGTPTSEPSDEDGSETSVDDPGSGPVPTHPTALRLLDATDWEPREALVLIEGEEDSAETAEAADEIRALVTLTPAELEAARRSAERPPRGPGEQKGD